MLKVGDIVKRADRPGRWRIHRVYLDGERVDLAPLDTESWHFRVPASTVGVEVEAP